MSKQTVANGLQIAGALGVIVAALMFSVTIGVLVGGLLAIAGGVIVERD